MPSYIQESDYAAAGRECILWQAVRQRTSMGLRSWTTGSDFTRNDGWEVFGGVRISKDAEGAIKASPAFQAKGYDIYPLDSMIDRPIHLEARVGGILVFLAALLAFGPALLVAFGLCVALVVAKKSDLDL